MPRKEREQSEAGIDESKTSPRDLHYYVDWENAIFWRNGRYYTYENKYPTK